MLNNDDPRWVKDNHTHECIMCGFSKDISYVALKSTIAIRFIATQPKRNLEKFHSQNPAVRAHIGKKEAKEEVALLKLQKNLLPLQRAKLKFERRFMGDTDDLKAFEELDENYSSNDAIGEVLSSNRAKAAAFLDMRLLLRSTVMDTKGWKASKDLLQKYYVNLCVCVLQSV